MEYSKESIGRKIKMARNEKGFTQEYLSELIGINNRTLNLMESGKSGMTIETLMKFCKYLDVTPNYLLSYTSEDKDLKDIIEHFTPNQKLILKEFLNTFEKLTDDMIN